VCRHSGGACNEGKGGRGANDTDSRRRGSLLCPALGSTARWEGLLFRGTLQNRPLHGPLGGYGFKQYGFTVRLHRTVRDTWRDTRRECARLRGHLAAPRASLLAVRCSLFALPNTERTHTRVRCSRSPAAAPCASLLAVRCSLFAVPNAERTHTRVSARPAASCRSVRAAVRGSRFAVRCSEHRAHTHTL
jgi:hypothetical protein